MRASALDAVKFSAASPFLIDPDFYVPDHDIGINVLRGNETLSKKFHSTPT